ncbi:MAG: enoyl-CoA hydratase-related protein [Rubrivivax sp.]|nr:enoyl-CoA hydratase-related protein [Rubrivivax sp.]
MADRGLTVERMPHGVLQLWLDRPAQRNALSLDLVQALRDALAAAEGDGTTRIVVLRGRGGHFCAGADLKDLATARARLTDDPDAVAKVNAQFGELCVAFAGTGLATVAVLEGAVMGGGLGLACAVDVAIAGRSASLRLPETRLGVVPAQIAPLLVERIGLSQARRLAITAARLDADAACALGLVHTVHDDGAALDAALADVLDQVLQCAPGAIAATKALMRRARLEAPSDLVGAAAQVFSDAALGPEGIEGTMAFLQKRSPRWAPAAP